MSSPGLTEFEANLLKLVDLITNGTRIEINPTGTSIAFIPGILQGGDHDDIFDTNTERGLGYYLEFLFLIAPFCKHKLDIRLSGRTNGTADPSVDIFKASGVKAIEKFLIISDGLKCEMKRRSIGPDAVKGLVHFSCPNPKKLKIVHESFIGKINKVRGLAYSCKVPPQLATRVGKVVRSSFSAYLKDTFIYNETNKCTKTSKGYGLVLVGESCNGQGEVVSTFSVEKCVAQTKDGKHLEGTVLKSPEELGQAVVAEFCDEISRMGVIDTHFQPLAVLYMMLTEQDVSSILLGPLTEQCITMLRLIKQFFNITFKVEEETFDDEADLDDDAPAPEMNSMDDGSDEDSENESDSEEDVPDIPRKVQLSCVGVGYSNMVRRMR